jgi:hypothetical protein
MGESWNEGLPLPVRLSAMTGWCLATQDGCAASCKGGCTDGYTEAGTASSTALLASSELLVLLWILQSGRISK